MPRKEVQGKFTSSAGSLPRDGSWPGHIKPGTVKNDIFSALDWVPTLVDIAGGPKDDELKKKIEAGQYPGIVKTTLDGIDLRDYLEGKSEKSARDVFFYYSAKDPSAVRYKNWKLYFAMVSDDPSDFVTGTSPRLLEHTHTHLLSRAGFPVGRSVVMQRQGDREWSPSQSDYIRPCFEH
jgi:arylsulfatase